MINYKNSQFIETIELLPNESNNFKYPYNVQSIRNFKKIDLHPNVNFFIGENGSGKSTLLEAIAISLGLNPEGGSRNFDFSTRESHSNLFNFVKIKKGLKKPKDYYFLRAESFYNVATMIEELDREAEESGGYGKPIRNFFGGMSLHEMSHGESFFTLLNKRFTGNGLYLLDEPEAALSIERQMATISRMHDLCQNGSQFLIATHSPVLLSYPNSKIFNVSEAGIKLQKYEDTNIFKQFKHFINNHETILKILMET